jgi:hypothetical protein
MIRSLMLAASLIFAITAMDAGPAAAKPCRNAAGKFIKCPPPPPPTKCRDAKGKFVKCTAPGAIPIVTPPKPATTLTTKPPVTPPTSGKPTTP